MGLLNSYICALDIGSSKLCACLCSLKRKHITNIFFATAPVKGVKRGTIVDSIELINCVSRILKELKASSGINFKFIYTNVSGQDLVTRHSQAIIPLAERGNRVITPLDIEKVNHQARILGSNLEEEIIQAIPFGYTIDSKTSVANPLGLYSHRLEVDLYLICAKLSFVQTLNRVINQAGYEIRELYSSGLATGRAVFNPELQEGLSILCDIGSDITEILFFKEGVLRDIAVLPAGGDDLTQQLSDALNIPFEVAEDLKKSYASVGDYGRITEDKEILLKKDSIYKPIKQRQVSEIITDKTRLLCQEIKEEINKFSHCEKISCVLATGRTVLLEGFLEMLENTLGTPVKIGRIADSSLIAIAEKDSHLLGQKYLHYLTGLGLLSMALKDPQVGALTALSPAQNLIQKTVNRFKQIYQEYF